MTFALRFARLMFWLGACCVPLMAGCVTPYQKYRIAGHRWIVADPESVNQHCKDVRRYRKDKGMTPSHADDGHILGPNDHVRCCWIPWKNTIVMGQGETDCALHEECHASGNPDAFCDKYIHLDGRDTPRQPLHVEQP